MKLNVDSPKATTSKLPVVFLVPHVKHKHTASSYLRDVLTLKTEAKMNPQEEKVMWGNQRRKQSKTKQNTKKIINILRELT